MERSKVRVRAAAPSEGFLALTLAALCGGAQTQGVATGLWVGKLDQRPGTSPPHELWAESAAWRSELTQVIPRLGRPVSRCYSRYIA